jgi:hypothetical protein
MLLAVSGELVNEKKRVRPTVRLAKKIVNKMVNIELTQPMIHYHCPIASLNSATPLLF